MTPEQAFFIGVLSTLILFALALIVGIVRLDWQLKKDREELWEELFERFRKRRMMRASCPECLSTRCSFHTPEGEEVVGINQDTSKIIARCLSCKHEWTIDFSSVLERLKERGENDG